MSVGTRYTITTELSPEGDYNIDTKGGSINNGYAYHKTKIVEQGDFLSSDYPLWVFASNNGGKIADPSKIRCYSVKIWQTNGVDGTYVLLRDMTPCMKDGRGGLYDAVNDEVLLPPAGIELATSSSAVWNNTKGDSSFDNPANWSTGAVPSDGDSVTVNISGDTSVSVSKVYSLSSLTVTGSGTLKFVGDGALSHKRLDIKSGVTVARTGTAGLVDGGLTGAGTFVLDPGEGNTLTMTKSNTGFTGEAVVKSGTVKLGNSTSFGLFNRASFIRVKCGATLDEADATDENYGDRKEKNKVILEEGATFVHSGSNTDDRTYPVTRLTLEGNATVDTSVKDVGIGLHYHDWYSHIDLGTNTLTVTGGKIFRISVCEISGTGTIDIQSGTKVYSTHEYDTTATVTTCNDGTINIREGATWHLYRYAVNGGRDGNLSVKNLVLDGAVTRDQPASTLTVTGSITGKGTTPMLTMGEGAVFKPNGTDYLTITESLSGTMMIDASGLDLNSTYDKIPLFKVGSAEMLPDVSVAFAAGTKPKGWTLVKTADGLGYDLARSGFSIILR